MASIRKRTTTGTRQKQVTEEALRESEERYRRLVEMSPDAIAIHVDGKFVYVNPAGVRLIGAPDEEALLGMPIANIVHPDFRSTVSGRVETMVNKGTGVPVIEEKFVRFDGTVVDVEVAAVPYLYKGQNAIQVIARDITEQKQARRVIQEWQDRYEKILTITGEVVYDWDILADKTVWTGTIDAVLGYTREEMDIRVNQYNLLIHPDDRQAIVRKIQDALDRLPVLEIEYRFRHKDGSYRFLRDHSFIFRNAEGKAFRSLGTLTDITEKKLAEQRDKENEQRYKALFEFSPSGILLEDATGTIVNVNDAMAAIVGYTRQELIGQNVDLFVPPNQRHEVQEHIAHILREERLDHVVTNVRKEGQIITLDLHERKIGLPGGTEGILVIANDVTERRRNERELKRQFEQQQAIFHLTEAINRATDIETIYAIALDVLTRALTTDRVSILTFDPDGVMRFKAWRGISDEYRRQVEGHSPWTPESKDPVPVLVPDVETDPSLASLLPIFRRENIRALGFVPLVYQGGIVGKFMVYYTDQHPFTDAESQVLQTFAGHIAFAIQRFQADLHLAESEERYRSLAEAANDAIISINRHDEVEYVNSFAEKLFQKRREDILGKHHAQLFSPEIAVSQGEILRSVFDTGRPAKSEFPLPLSNGVHWFDTRYVPVKEKQGAIISVLGISRDITERKNVEEALRKNTEQQGLVLRSLPMVFYTSTLTPGMPTTWISEQVKDITGFDPEEFTRNCTLWQSRLHPLDKDWVIREYESVVTRGAIRLEYRWRCADGLYRWFADQTVLIDNGEGAPREVIGIWLDITSRKVAEDELRESEAKWRSLMENSPGLVHMIDRDGRIVYINRATEGYERDHVIGSTVYDYVTPEIARFLESKVKEVFDQKRSVWFEMPAAGPYGSEAWYSASIGPVLREGNVAFAIMVSIDITEHKHRENLQNGVYRIAQIADRAQNLDELYKAVHEIIRESMRANNFYIALYDEVQDILTFPYFVDEIDIPLPPGPPGRGMTAYVLRSGKSLLCGAEKFEELVRDGEIELVGISSPVWVGVPLIVENKVIGVMALQDYHDEEAYNEQDLHMLEYISSQVAMTIHRKQTEEELRSSEERYRLLFEESKDCIYITSADGKIVDINPAGVELFGFATEEELYAVDVSHDLFWDPMLREEESRILRRQGYVQDFQLTLKKKDGTKLIVLDTATTVRDEHGGITGYRGIMRDMTERTRAEEALRQSETKLREIVEHSTNLFYSHTPDHILTFVSPQTRTFFDCEPEEALIRWTELLTENPINNIGYELTKRAIETGKSQVPYRLELVGKKGRKIWVEVNESPVVVNGKTVAVVGSLTNITEKVNAEGEISKLRKAVETSTEVIFITDLEGIITYINPEFTRLYGYTADEVIGRATPRILKGGLINEEEYGSLWKRILGKQFIKREFVNRSKTGKQIIVDSSISPILNEQGTIDGFLAIQLDITDRKRLEEQFLRTQRLESLGTLAGGVAHDLNNVLAPILLSIEVLKRYTTNDHSKKILMTLGASAERGKQIIKQILSFARGSEGEKGNIQLKHLIDEMEQIARETFPRSIEVRSSVQKDLWTVAGDPTQLHQVLLNLCVNARDAMPNGGMLDLRAENIHIDEQMAKMQYGAKVGSYVVVAVSDTGTGIAPDVLPKVFDPFFTTKAQGQGTGLGLSTVHAIVKGHDGFIDIYTHVNKGTTFKVYIPAYEITSPASSIQSPTDYPSGNGEWILVVDDEVSVRDITRYTLEMYKYNVLTANNGARALEIYKERQSEIALVLTDMMMPVMDGASMIQELRAINPQVKIIASSGFSSNTPPANAMPAEIQGFLGKPYTTENLLTTLHTVLSQS